MHCLKLIVKTVRSMHVKYNGIFINIVRNSNKKYHKQNKGDKICALDTHALFPMKT